MENPSDQSAQDMLDYFLSFRQREIDKENDPEWQKNNMEYDMRTSKVMVEKVRNREEYAQNLYAAMCNNSFIKNDTWPLLTEQTWSASWRSSGGIVAHMRGEGDYIDWYCSGIKNGGEPDGSVPESIVTNEIREDLKKLGWIVLEETNE